MTEILPIIISAACTALLGGVIGFHIGYATRNPKRKEEHSSLHTTRYPVDAPPVPTPLKEEPQPACQQYVLCVDLKHGVDEQFAWDTIEKIYTNRPDNILVIRLRNGVEHTYTNAIKYRVYPATGVEDWMYWEEYKKENEEEE